MDELDGGILFRGPSKGYPAHMRQYSSNFNVNGGIEQTDCAFARRYPPAQDTHRANLHLTSSWFLSNDLDALRGSQEA